MRKPSLLRWASRGLAAPALLWAAAPAHTLYSPWSLPS